MGKDPREGKEPSVLHVHNWNEQDNVSISSAVMKVLIMINNYKLVILQKYIHTHHLNSLS